MEAANAVEANLCIWMGLESCFRILYVELGWLEGGMLLCSSEESHDGYKYFSFS